MRKTIIHLVFLIAYANAFSQTNGSKYSILVKKAATYYYQKNYKVSALTYSQAFKSNQGEGTLDDRFNAACSWALSKIPDSAFFQLNYIAKEGYSNYNLITTERDLMALRKDKRWNPLIAIVQENKRIADAKLNKPLILELDSIYSDDQTDRSSIDDIEKKFGYNSKEVHQLWREMSKMDSIDIIKVKAILKTWGWLGPDVVGERGNTTLWLVIQHSDLKTQEEYLPIMKEAAKNGKAKPSALALLEDRVALGEGKKQIYGSQIIRDAKTGRDTLAPIEDYPHVDERRASVGLGPLSEYVSHWGIVLNRKAQTSKKEAPLKYTNNDFATAMEIHDSIVGPINVSMGPGPILDFDASGTNTGLYKEDNSAWFKFTINYDTLLTFDIVPNDPHDDYDFILFKCLSPDCGEEVRTNKITPDRECFSQNFDGSGSTGLSEYSEATFLPGGPGPAYVAALPVKAGETCYLMVNFPANYFTKPKGFTLYFYNYWPKKPKDAIRDKLTAANNTVVNHLILQNILFENNTAALTKESYVILDKLVSRLLIFKTMKVQIIGHTDNNGDEVKNQKLSEERAEVVVKYLISKNIDSSRLTSTGYGSRRPIASNNTEEGRKKNRRVEFVARVN